METFVFALLAFLCTGVLVIIASFAATLGFAVRDLFRRPPARASAARGDALA